MGYQFRLKATKWGIHKYEKRLRERSKDRKHIHRLIGGLIKEEKHAETERDISDVTLKRLHTLGNQRFGSYRSASISTDG